MSRRHRRGGVAVIIALSMVVLMGFAALVVDLGYARLVQSQLQSAADAAAMGGAARLDGTVAGLDDARETAVAVAAMNEVRKAPLVLDANVGNAESGDVVLGRWDSDAGTFTATTDPTLVNAVRVNARDDEVAPLFSKVAWNKDEMGVGVSSTARRGEELGAGGVSWYLPFGLADCLFETSSDEDLVDLTFRLNPDGADNTGWTAIGTHPSASWAKNHLEDAVDCMNEWYETGEVSSEDCTNGEVGTTAQTNNGEVTSGLQTIEDLLESSEIPWDESVWGDMPAFDPLTSSLSASTYGHVLMGPFPVIDATDDYCSDDGGKWNASFTVLGFVWGVIYDVKSTGSASKKNVKVRIDPLSSYDMGESWGGGDYGVTVSGPPVLIQ